LANVRITIFESKNTKANFVENFARNIMELVSHKQDFSNIKIFREILKMIQKFQNNFGVRGIISCEKEGLLEAYL
jgi:hypothetical protein